MSLRIVAGELGGRRISAPGGRRTRPTPERVREAWFSALHGRVVGARVLDLFAGSGALGLEALSRGAASATFVERSRRAASVLAENVRELGVEDRSEIRVEDVFTFLEDVGEGRWELALADPPYAGEAAADLLRRWDRAPFSGWLCVEHASDRVGALDRVRRASWRREYGDTGLSFYGREDDGSGPDDHSEGGGER